MYQLTNFRGGVVRTRNYIKNETKRTRRIRDRNDAREILGNVERKRRRMRKPP